jgi:DNA repair exonuclease SbcCD ATPase subunit
LGVGGYVQDKMYGDIRESLGSLAAHTKSLEELILRIEEDRENSEKIINDALTGEIDVTNKRVDDFKLEINSINARIKAMEVSLSLIQEKERKKKEKIKKILGYVAKASLIVSPFILKSLWDVFNFGQKLADLIRAIVNALFK